MQNDPRILAAYQSADQFLGHQTVPQKPLTPKNETTLFSALADACDLFFLPSTQTVKEHVIMELPHHQVLWQKALPIQEHEHCFWAFANIQDLEDIKRTCDLIQSSIQLCITCPSTLYPLIDSIQHQRFYQSFQSEQHSTESHQIIDCVEHLLSHAIETQSSDVHIEPQANFIQIRFRIDGLLQFITTLPIALAGNIVSRIKILSELNITETRLPQDGRFQFSTTYNIFDCRVSFCPTQFGEKVVIRLLNSQTRIRSFDELGFSASLLNIIKPPLKKPHGLILITGPTGSGKTQTLYTILHYLHNTQTNISTIEDPIEIQMPGINQIHIKPSIGLNFACVLKALLRQDPDIIMLGEIRDQETAEIAIRAAQTGHLVLSTLHTNSADKTLQRLVNMGVKPYNLLDCIHLIIAQRLIRVLCPHCKIPLNDKEKSELQERYNQPLYHHRIYRASGCNQCHQGYREREGIFEVALSGDAMNQALYALINTATLSSLPGFTIQSLMEDGMNKVKRGLTSVDEVLRVTSLE